MSNREFHTVSSPVGQITLGATDSHLVSLDIDGQSPTFHNPEHPILKQAARELAQYFEGVRNTFEVPVRLSGTPFQEAIWRTLAGIPYGETVSYGELGQLAGFPGSARAVGGAVGANPLPIIVPCHRVLGVTKKITGYSSGQGIPTKEILLRLENISYAA